MGNHTYVISERLFHKDKDEKTKAFLAGTDIDLDAELHPGFLTIQKIKNILSSLGYVMDREEILYEQKEEWQCAINKNGELKVWLIVTEFIDCDTEIGMLEIGRGSDDQSAMEIFLALVPSCGKFLYYLDAGPMASISEGKTIEQIHKEYTDY